MGDFKTIETQEELDRLITGRLKKQSEGYEAKIKELESQIKESENLKERLNTLNLEREQNNSKIDELNKNIQGLNSVVEEFKLKEMKANIAMEYKLPLEFAERLKGNTEEDIESDAEVLRTLWNAKTSLPLKSSTKEDFGSGQGNDYKELLKGLNI